MTVEPDGSGRARSRLTALTTVRAAARPPVRIRVTSPQMAARPRPALRLATSEIDEQTEVGELYMRSLLRQQLRLGLTVLAVLVLALGSLPVLFAVVPRLAGVRWLGVPLPWLMVGVGVYPLLVLAAAWHVRAAERAERDFAEIIERH